MKRWTIQKHDREQVIRLSQALKVSPLLAALLISRGFDSEAAARFSFLLMIPAITASGLLELKEAIQKHLLSSDDFAALAVGTIVAGVVGYLSIWFLLAFLRKRSTAVFIIYRIVVGAIILVLLRQGVLNPQV